jgi:RNAse (barnase) inhibitor barstar
MKTIIVDCKGVRSEVDFWQRYLDAARPKDAQLFGRNLDAFWDAIEGGGPGWPGEVELIFQSFGDLDALPRRFVKALEQIAEDTTRVKIRMTGER